jgi:acyl-CoA synthetase (NDP forming)
LQSELADAARRWSLPVCGPNGNGIVALHERAALWGDAVAPAAGGPVALVSQSGNVAVNALGARRGLRLHTVVSCGNGAVLDAADFTGALAALDGVRSIALYLEDDGDGPRWCAALEACARAGVAVAVLKAGSSRAGAAAAQAHTAALAGDQRVVRALFDEAGAAWARDPHELLELAKALATRRPSLRAPSGGGLAVMTCSGGDSAVAADLAAEMGLRLPALAPRTVERLRETLPEAATPANPLDYTALLWYDQAALRALVLVLADDPAIDRVLVLFDSAMRVGGEVDESWAGIVAAVRAAGRVSPVPVALASTLPELLEDDVAAQMIEEGMPALAGLAPALRCMQALAAPPADPGRIAAIAAAASRARSDGADGWLAEHETKSLLRDAGLPVVSGRLAADADDAVAALGELGGRVALKLSAPGLTHKTERGAVVLGLATDDEVRAGESHLRSVARRGAGLAAPEGAAPGPAAPEGAAPGLAAPEGAAAGVARAAVLVEAMAPSGVELLVAARRGGLVPVLVLGLGGALAELLDDVAVVPLPATPERVERALRTLRGAPLLTGARGRPAVDVTAAARLAAGAGDLLLAAGLDLLELNPVIVHERGAVAVDALARRAIAPDDEESAI